MHPALRQVANREASETGVSPIPCGEEHGARFIGHGALASETLTRFRKVSFQYDEFPLAWGS
jgi:hypothetical protein